ncbi:unnamed protein product, partial [Protopolystoma xenopodis]
DEDRTTRPIHSCNSRPNSNHLLCTCEPQIPAHTHSVNPFTADTGTQTLNAGLSALFHGDASAPSNYMAWRPEALTCHRCIISPSYACQQSFDDERSPVGYSQGMSFRSRVLFSYINFAFSPEPEPHNQVTRVPLSLPSTSYKATSLSVVQLRASHQIPFLAYFQPVRSGILSSLYNLFSTLSEPLLPPALARSQHQFPFFGQASSSFAPVL